MSIDPKDLVVGAVVTMKPITVTAVGDMFLIFKHGDGTAEDCPRISSNAQHTFMVKQHMKTKSVPQGPYNDLEDYIAVMYNEYGEALETLLNLQMLSIHLSDDFNKAVDAECAYQLAQCQAHAKVYKVTRTTTREEIAFDVEWDDEISS